MRVDRRKFLKTGLLGAAAVSLGRQALGAAEAAPPASPGPLPTRPLGRTGHLVTLFGLGGQAGDQAQGLPNLRRRRRD